MISTEIIKQALEVGTSEQQAKIRLLNKAVAENLKEYQSKYSMANLNAWRAAEKALEDFIGEVFLDQGGDTAAVYFENLNQVLAHLKGNLWKVSSTTLYNHRTKGLLISDQSGRFLASDVDKYAARNLKRMDGSPGESESKDIKDKRQAEIRKAKAQAKHWEIKAKVAAGLYVPREHFEQQLAARASIFKSDLLSFCRSLAPEIIDMVDGDEQLAPDLIDFMTEKTLIHLDRYSRSPDQETE